MARRIAALIPSYEYDERPFLPLPTTRRTRSPRRRRAGFMRLAELYRTRFAETAQLTAEAADDISDLQFTGAYRVPFQFSRLVREHLKAARSSQSSARRDADRSRRQLLLRL